MEHIKCPAQRQHETAWRKDLIAFAERSGIQIDFDAVIGPGDLYLAKRNGPPTLQECHHVDTRNFIVSTDPYCYSFDTWECVKVVALIGKEK